MLCRGRQEVAWLSVILFGNLANLHLVPRQATKPETESPGDSKGPHVYNTLWSIKNTFCGWKCYEVTVKKHGYDIEQQSQQLAPNHSLGWPQELSKNYFSDASVSHEEKVKQTEVKTPAVSLKEHRGKLMSANRWSAECWMRWMDSGADGQVETGVSDLELDGNMDSFSRRKWTAGRLMSQAFFCPASGC